MTDKERMAVDRMLKHKDCVAKYMAKFSAELAYRAAIHDESKFTEGEFEIFSAHVSEFGKYPYDSPEERDLRERMAPAVLLHRQRNRHHPEHFPNGMEDMNLIDLVEMLVDWKAAAERTPGDSICKSMPIMRDKYNISPQLVKILENTLKDFRMY